jgi:syntaxin-binding protein 1
MEPSEDGHGHAPGQGGIPLSGVSLRTTKPTWSKKTNSTSVSLIMISHPTKLTN